MEDVVGQLNFRGDIRAGYKPQTYPTMRYGVVVPVAVEYDEAADLTRVSFATHASILAGAV